ncbi:MAG: pyridoxal-phosphate dependent enzyme, partial [Myxococcales bacterium]|nr:pyridoxal-phosphate dependent enzyme [Myxococcales bacterium]
MPTDPRVSVANLPAVRVVDGVCELVGRTPLVRLRRVGDPARAPIYVKLEQHNPGGSMRDRYVLEVLQRAVAGGQLVQGDHVALAGLDDSAVSAAVLGPSLGVCVRVFAPEGSNERLLSMIERFGAEVCWTSASGGLPSAVEEAAAWAREAPGRLFVDGFRRQAVRNAYGDIAREILEALHGRALGSFITSVTTGGTFREVSRHLRETSPDVRVGGAVLLDDVPLEALGAREGDVLRRVSLEEAWRMRDILAKQEGVFVG